MDHAENQARRFRDRRVQKQAAAQGRKDYDCASGYPAKGARHAAASGGRGRARRAAGAGKARASIAVHSFPARATVVEPHILKNGEAIALKPLTIEEAVKEAEFRDRDLLIFRTNLGRYVCASSPPGRADGVGGDSLETESCFGSVEGACKWLAPSRSVEHFLFHF